ncbi:MAG TPA: DUF2834 domain-containing protein [Burkholderiaceae bacterium]
MHSKNLLMVYRLAAAAGLIVPWYFNLRFLQAGGGFAPGQFWPAAFANHLTAGFTLDVYMSAGVFALWVFPEARRCGIARPWLYVVLCFLGALACALPLFLAVRERALQRSVS